MSSKSVIGYALLAIGVLILAFTFYQAFEIFHEINTGTFQMFSTSQPTPIINQNTSIQGAINTAISSAFASLHLGGYAESFMLLVILALFASIGYKFAKLGVEMLKASWPAANQTGDAKKAK
jgi:dolichol kinase